MIQFDASPDAGESVFSSTQRSDLTVLSRPRFGSRRSSSTAACTAAGLGDAPLGARAPGWPPAGPASSSATMHALRSKRTAKLLFDIPGLQFDAPVQIHSEAGGDVEWFDEGYGRRVGDRQFEALPVC